MKNRDFEAARTALADEHAALLTLCSGSRYCLSGLGGNVTYCTVVEFEWGEGLDRERFAGMMASVGAGQSVPEGRLSHIAGIDDTGARVIEVWRSGDDARRFAEQSRPSLAAAAMPAPTRVFGFEVSSYVVS